MSEGSERQVSASKAEASDCTCRRVTARATAEWFRQGGVLRAAAAKEQCCEQQQPHLALVQQLVQQRGPPVNKLGANLGKAAITHRTSRATAHASNVTCHTSHVSQHVSTSNPKLSAPSARPVAAAAGGTYVLNHRSCDCTHNQHDPAAAAAAAAHLGTLACSHELILQHTHQRAETPQSVTIVHRLMAEGSAPLVLF